MAALPEDRLRISIARLARRMRFERADPELSEAQLAVVFELAKHGPQTLGSLAGHEGVSSPSMNRTVGALAARGLVTRHPSPEDGRKVVIELTDAGNELVRETRRRRQAWFSQAVARLSPAERRHLLESTPILEALVDS